MGTRNKIAMDGNQEGFTLIPIKRRIAQRGMKRPMKGRN
jgi:hypothetical protein